MFTLKIVYEICEGLISEHGSKVGTKIIYRGNKMDWSPDSTTGEVFIDFGQGALNPFGEMQIILRKGEVSQINLMPPIGHNAVYFKRFITSQEVKEYEDVTSLVISILKTFQPTLDSAYVNETKRVAAIFRRRENH